MWHLQLGILGEVTQQGSSREPRIGLNGLRKNTLSIESGALFVRNDLQAGLRGKMLLLSCMCLIISLRITKLSSLTREASRHDITRA
jgi:hypothetical protein